MIPIKVHCTFWCTSSLCQRDLKIAWTLAFLVLSIMSHDIQGTNSSMKPTSRCLSFIQFFRTEVARSAQNLEPRSIPWLVILCPIPNDGFVLLGWNPSIETMRPSRPLQMTHKDRPCWRARSSAPVTRLIELTDLKKVQIWHRKKEPSKMRLQATSDNSW
jgi:hypothetical protein